MSSHEIVVAAIRLGSRSLLRITINTRDGRILLRKFTRNGERIFMPTVALPLDDLTEARAIIAGLTKAVAEVTKR